MKYATAILLLFAILAVIGVTACVPALPTKPAAPVTPVPPTQPAAPPDPIAPTATTDPADIVATVPPADPVFDYEGVQLKLDSSLYTFANGKTVAWQPATPETPFWAVYPKHIEIELVGFPVNKNENIPQLYVYPVEEYRSMSQPAVEALDGLAEFISEKPADIKTIPALPLRNSIQSMHSNVKFLNFQNGSGVRFLAFYSQGPVPVNSFGLFYTYQGLTADGKYAVAVVLPAQHADLPRGPETLSMTELETLFAGGTYYTDLAATLSAQPDSAFWPDLAALDALVQSIKIETE